MAPYVNYITPRGYKRLQDELDALWGTVRPKVVDEVHYAASLGDRSENAEYIYGKKKLRKIDRRVRWLRKRLEAAQVVDPAIDRGTRVFFGATVVLAYEDGTERRLDLVGEDEIEPEKGRISWRSPIGRAVMRREEGDAVSVKGPEGLIDVEIAEVEYCEQDPDDESQAIFRDISLGER